MALENYFDFAENDYNYFVNSANHGLVANMMAAMAQNICEKYMKHLINEFYEPQTLADEKDLEKILHTHNLNGLIKFLRNNLEVSFSKEAKTQMNVINGFYYNTRYPGDESFEVDKEDIEDCMKAITLCRKEIVEFIKILEQRKQKAIPLEEQIAHGKEVQQQNVKNKEQGSKNVEHVRV